MSAVPELSAREMNLVAIAFMSPKGDTAHQIDYNKFAELGGYKTAASASTAFTPIKKKLLAGATVNKVTTAAPTPQKAKGKATTDGNGEDDNEPTPTKAAPKKRAKAIKTEPADADTEITPSIASPKKGRAKKPTAPDANGDSSDVTQTNTPTPKRKRGPTKPKDPNATPSKRAKKGANALAGTEIEQQGSIFGGDGADVVKKEEEDDDRPFDAVEQEMFKQAQADDALFGTDTAGSYLA